LQSIDELRELKNQAYQASEDAGIIIKPSWIKELTDEIKDTLAEKGWTPERVPAVTGVLKAIERAQNGNITLKGVDSIRQVAGNLGGTLDDLQTYLGRQITKKIDKHVDRLDMSHVIPGIGNLTQATTSLKHARRLNVTMRKAEVVEEALTKAERLAAGQNTTFYKALQTQFRGILNSKTRRKGFTSEELREMEKLARGTMTQAMLGKLSVLSPSSKLNVLMQGTAGIASGGAHILPQIGAAALGAAAQATGSQMSRNNVYGLARLIRQNGMTPGLAAQARRMRPAERSRLNKVLQGWNVTGAEVEP
jgi:hypothetical protein